MDAIIKEILAFFSTVVDRVGAGFVIAASAIASVTFLVAAIAPDIEQAFLLALIGVGAVVLIATGFYIYRYLSGTVNGEKKG
jgi:hypothetical protein